MPYTAEISSDNPSCFLFLIDQSTSMAEEISAGDTNVAKATGVSDTMNRWLSELSMKIRRTRVFGLSIVIVYAIKDFCVFRKVALLNALYIGCRPLHLERFSGEDW